MPTNNHVVLHNKYNHTVSHEMVSFSDAYRIGILTYYTDYAIQEQINNYKKELEKLGYECEVLLFVNKKEKDNKIYLQSFNHIDLDKNLIPNSPRTDRFIIRKFDLLLNLFFENSIQLIHIARMSSARCRVSPYLNQFIETSDILIPCNENNTIAHLISQINKTLKLQPYERKEI